MPPLFGSSTKWRSKFVQSSGASRLEHWHSFSGESTSQLQVFIYGRPIPDVDVWRDFKGQRGFISEIVARKYSQSSRWDWPREFSGVFAILILDARSAQMHLLTDPAGVCPVYCANPDTFQSVELSTHPDLLVDHSKTDTLDYVSVAQFLSQGMVQFPYSYWAGVNALENGCVHTWDALSGKYSSQKYFEICHRVSASRSQIQDELIQSIEASIARRTVPQFGKSMIFLSGGLDSRMLAAQLKTNASSASLFDVQNTEYRAVEEIVKALNLSHRFIRRGVDYYSKTALTAPRITGGYSSFTNAHFNLLIDRNPEIFLGVDTLFTGCFADWLFKGIAHNRERTRLMGRILPHYKFAEFDTHFFGANSKVLGPCLSQLSERNQEFYAGIDCNDRDQVEAKRLFPLYQEETSATRLSLQRIADWDPPFIDRDVLTVYTKVPWKLKKNHDLFEKVCLALAPQTRGIPHSGTGKYLEEGNLRFFGRYAWSKASQVRRDPAAHDFGVYGHGSWLNFPRYLENSEIQRIWNEISMEARDVVCNATGRNLWILSADQFREIDYHLFYNAVTFGVWFDTRLSRNRPLVPAE